jgi:NADH-quinone oxidoreductase subunit D
MESLIKHFKASTSGFALPAEKPIPAERRIGVLMVSDGTARPYRVKIKSPDYASLQRHTGRGYYIADVVAIIGSLDVVGIDR